MAQPLANMMSGLSLVQSPGAKDRIQPSSTASNPTGGGNRLPPVMKKYMNPNLVRPANTGLAAHSTATTNSYNDSQRGPLLKLAGVNVPEQSRHSSIPKAVNNNNNNNNNVGSPAKSHAPPKHSISQHTAHGIHGPAHSTTSRALSSSINPHHSTHPTVASAVRKVDIGKYDGGFEADEAGKEVVTGEAAKILEMDSGASGSVAQPSDIWTMTHLPDPTALAQSPSICLRLQSADRWGRVNSVVSI